MLNDSAILIVEDNVYLALDLSQAVEESYGRVVGPVATGPKRLSSSNASRLPRRSSIPNWPTAT